MGINMRWEKCSKWFALKKCFSKFITSIFSSYLTQNELRFLLLLFVRLFVIYFLSMFSSYLSMYKFPTWQFIYGTSMCLCLYNIWCVLKASVFSLLLLLLLLDHMKSCWCTNHKTVVFSFVSHKLFITWFNL